MLEGRLQGRIALITGAKACRNLKNSQHDGKPTHTNMRATKSVELEFQEWHSPSAVRENGLRAYAFKHGYIFIVVFRL